MFRKTEDGAERGVDLVREVNPVRNRLDPPHAHLEVARGEAMERHRAVIGNAALVELAADQTRQVRVDHSA